MEKHDEKHVHHCGCGHCHQAQEAVHRTEEHAHHEEDEENHSCGCENDHDHEGHSHEHGCACGHDHDHEGHSHEHGCTCGHDHDHEGHSHEHGCGCGHDHDHEGHSHEHECACGHDHDHEGHSHEHGCTCGHDHDHEGHSHEHGCGCGCGHDHDHEGHSHEHNGCGCGCCEEIPEERHDHSNDPEMAKYKDNKIDVMESDADIAIDERRAFGHFHDKGIHHHDGHKNDCHCHDCIDEEDCDYCGKDLASCQCDFLGKEYKRGLYHMEHLDCMECAAKMEGKIREMPSVFFASISFTKKELRVISKENPDSLIPQLLSVCRTVDENIGIVPPSDKGDFKTEIYEIPTLDCAACAVKLEKLVNRQPGVLSASISFATKTMKLTAKDPDSLIPELTRKCNEVENPTEIRKKQRPTKAQKKSAAKKEASFLDRLKSEKCQLTIGGLLFIIGMLMHYQPAGLFAGLSSIGDYFFFISYLILGGPIVYTALKNITHGEFFDETFLMTVATVGAFAIHEYPEAVGVMLFYRIGEYFQDLAADRSRDQIMDAVDLRPEVVQRVTASGTETIPAEEAEVGDILLIRPGDRIPLDGIISEGETQIDTSAVTGEPKPVLASVGDLVDSGCVNMTGTIRIQVEKVLAESMVTRILDSVENAVASKPKIDRFITRFSRVYTPIVVFVAIAVAVLPPLLFSADWEKCVYTALTFLVISCPCALVISVPLSFFAGIGAASKEGILFKGGTVMEALSNTKAAVLDKTGTLTEGKFKVRSIVKTAGKSEDEILALAAAAEIYSTHPIAQSIVTCANEKGLSLPKLTSMQEIAGHGVKAKQNGEDIYIGNEKLLALSGISVPSLPENKEVGTDVYVAKGKTLLGRITISDAIKSDTIEGIQDLKALDITPVMLTGDNEKSAKAIGSLVGIENIHAGLLPEDKLSEMQKVRKEIGSVLFVGDGINDAPVLAGADVGAAMGSGADAAIEAADVVFLNSNVNAISKAVRVARKVIKTAWENVAFALIVKIAVMIMGLLGYANMWVAVFADTGVTILCILYAVRLLRVKF